MDFSIHPSLDIFLCDRKRRVTELCTRRRRRRKRRSGWWKDKVFETILGKEVGMQMRIY